MRIGQTLRASTAIALALMAACGSEATHTLPRDRGSRPRCEADFVPPAGFRATERVEDAYPDRIGVRLAFRDDRGRDLHVFAGIRGEFGEGLPLDGRLKLASGQEVRLIGESETWVIAWDEGGPCGPHAVIGDGFGKGSFLDALDQSGVT